MDITTIFKFASEYGIFPVLFVASYFIIIKEFKERIKDQQILYDKMSEDLESVMDAMEDMKESIRRMDVNISNISQESARIGKLSDDLMQLKISVGTIEAITKNQ